MMKTTGFFSLLFLLASTLASAAEIDREKELVVRHLSVVEDSRAKTSGAWSFMGVMREIAPESIPIREFLSRWMRQWQEVTELNGFAVEPRPAIRYEGLWHRDSQGQLDLERAPYRLTAIVYRPDLSEARLVYCGVRKEDGGATQLSLIFEFRLPGDPASWARAFHRLGSLPFGAEYNAELERITRRAFVRENFLQLRSNDFLGLPTWELRQFQINDRGLLVQTPLPNTPDLSFDEDDRRSDELISVIRQNERQILDGTYEFPASFLAGASVAKEDRFRWLYAKRDRLPEPTRRAASRLTCNGCHTGDTRTIFTHIGTRGPTHAAPLSPFLAGEETAKRILRMTELLAD